MVPDPTFNDFSKFFDGFVVAFCVRPLVCHHVFCNCFGISFGLFFEFPHLSATNHQNKKHGGGFCAQRTEIIILYGIFGVLIIPKWLIKVPGHIPILFK